MRRRGDVRQTAGINLLPLTPEYDSDQHDVYVNAVEEALASSELITNIALTGDYGVGKSSILRKVAENHPTAITISLSTLGLPNGDGGGEDSKTNRIQKEIVKQLLYRERPHQLQGSRFRRIGGRDGRRTLRGACVLSPVLLLAADGVGWSGKFQEQLHAQTLGAWFQLILLAGLLAASYVGLAMSHNRIAVKGLKVASADISLDAPNTTYFDQFLDEIVYFFEMTKKNIVIFEDIDRFGVPQIFETLRALNTLLNGAAQISTRPIRFVYAVRDSIFEEPGLSDPADPGVETRPEDEPLDAGTALHRSLIAQANRTKFFSLVIPVVPFISHTNARDLAGRTMRGIVPPISDDLLDVVARFVPDMRLLKNVRNEFLIFKAKLLDSEDALDLEPNNLFAMMLYKNTRLGDFERIRTGTSRLDRLYEDSRSLVRDVTEQLADQSRELRARLSEPDAINAELAEELGARLLNYLVRLARHFNTQGTPQFQINAQVYAGDAVLGPAFWEQVGALPENGAFSVNGIGIQQITITRADLSEIVGDPLSRARWEDRRREDLIQAINAIAEKRYFVTHANFLQLYDAADLTDKSGRSFAEAVVDRLGPGLAERLVARGFLDQDFALYASTYYGDKLSANAQNFLLHHVAPNVMDIEYILEPSDVDAILKQMGGDVLRERAMYNLSVLNHLIEVSGEPLATLTRSLSMRSEAADEFMDVFLDSTGDHEGLIESFATHWPGTFEFVMSRQDLDDSQKVALVNAGLTRVDGTVDYVSGPDFKDFIEKRAADLPILRDVGISAAHAAALAALFAKGGVKLPRLDCLSPVMLQAVLDADAYEIGVSNLETAVGEGNLALDRILAVNPSVYSYLTANVGQYIDILRGNQRYPYCVEAPDELPRVIRSVAQHEPRFIADVVAGANLPLPVVLLDFTSDAWPALAARGAFIATFANVAAYIHEVGEIDSNLGRLLANAPAIEEIEQISQADRQSMALHIVSAVDAIGSAAACVALVVSLKLDARLPREIATTAADSLVGPLFEAGFIEDDEQTFNATLPRPWSVREQLIGASEAFTGFMSPALILLADVPALLRSSRISSPVKQVVLDRFDEYIPEGTDDVDALRAAADYAAGVEYQLTFAQLTRISRVGIDDATTADLLSIAATGLPWDQLRLLMADFGGWFQKLVARDGKRPKVPNTEATRRLVRHLEDVGEISSSKEVDGEIEVNLKRPSDAGDGN